MQDEFRNLLNRAIKALETSIHYALAEELRKALDELEEYQRRREEEYQSFMLAFKEIEELKFAVQECNRDWNFQKEEIERLTRRLEGVLMKGNVE